MRTGYLKQKKVCNQGRLQFVPTGIAPILVATGVVARVAAAGPVEHKSHFCCGEHNSLWCHGTPQRIFYSS
jgi:hypothetical protein